MNPRSIALWVALLAVGMVVGATGDHYWNEQVRKAESALALDKANAAAKSGNIDDAIVFAAQSYALYPESPLAGFMLRELVQKRAEGATGREK